MMMMKAMRGHQKEKEISFLADVISHEESACVRPLVARAC